MKLRWGLFTRKGKARNLRCSFCGKDSESVNALIAGPTVFICDECVATCNKCLGGETPPASTPHWDKCSDAELLEQLTRSSAVAEAASAFLDQHVDALRKRGVAWAEIGKALGVSRQAAWERFS